VYGRRFAVQSLGLFTVTNTGTITCSTQAILLSDGGFVDNSRLITGEQGVGIGGVAGTVDNAGTISSYDPAVALTAGGTVSNAGTGSISVTGTYAAVSISGGAGTVTNAGTLSGYFGVQFVGTYDNTLIDTGTIIGRSGTAVAFGSGDDCCSSVRRPASPSRA